MVRCFQERQLSDAEVLRRLLDGACEIDEQLLEQLLAEGLPPRIALRRASRGWWQTGAALLLGGALALSSVQGVAAREVTAPTASANRGTGALSAWSNHFAGAVDAANSLEAVLAQTPVVAETVLFIPDMSADNAPGLQTGQLYTVVAGDSLWTIAKRFYGDGTLWANILRANSNLIADPNWIFPGQNLTIPAQQATPTAPAAGSTYAVKQGDCLWNIALKLYGNAQRWQDIYNLNKSTIGGNSSLIKPGAVLKLP